MKLRVPLANLVAALAGGMAAAHATALPTGAPAAEAPASAASAAPYRASPHVLAARQRALAASAPRPVAMSPLTQHKPHRPMGAPQQP